MSTKTKIFYLDNGENTQHEMSSIKKKSFIWTLAVSYCILNFVNWG
jgi:hypothetical protein